MLGKNIVLLAGLLIATSLWAAPTPTQSSLIHAIERAQNLTESQVAVKRALEGFANGLASCEASLQSRGSGPIQSAVEHAPSWLFEAAKLAFLENEELPAPIVQSLNQHQFLTQVSVALDAKGSLSSVEVEDHIKRALLETNPLSDNGTKGVAIQISKFKVSQSLGKNSFSMQLDLKFDNGEVQRLSFDQAPIGNASIEEAVTKLVVASINQRSLLSSDQALRREMNALRFNLLKLIRVTNEATANEVNAMAEELKDAQPKPAAGRMLSFFGIGRIDSIMGRSFLTYLSVKERIVEMSTAQQRAQEASFGRVNRDAMSPTGYVSRQSRVPQSRQTFQGYYYPRTSSSVRSAVSSSYTNSDSYDVMTWMWIMDPSFMITHPWYWGAPDGSFRSSFMLFNWMTDSSRTHDPNGVFQPGNTTYDQNQMTYFDQPVDPIYTNNPNQPVVDPWNANGINPDSILQPTTGRDGSVQWNDTNGQNVDAGVVTGAAVDQSWSRFSGTDYDPARTTQTDTTQPQTTTPDSPLSTPDETQRFDRGSDGSGYNSSPASSTPDPAPAQQDSSPAADSSIQSS